MTCKIQKFFWLELESNSRSRIAVYLMYYIGCACTTARLLPGTKNHRLLYKRLSSSIYVLLLNISEQYTSHYLYSPSVIIKWQYCDIVTILATSIDCNNDSLTIICRLHKTRYEYFFLLSLLWRRTRKVSLFRLLLAKSLIQCKTVKYLLKLKLTFYEKI